MDAISTALAGVVTSHPVLVGVVFIIVGIEKILEFVGVLKGGKITDNVGVILGNLVKRIVDSTQNPK